MLFPYSYIGIGLTPPAILRSTISATLLAGEEPPWASLAEETEPSEPPASWDRIDNWLNAAAADMLQRAMRAEEKEEEEAAEAVAGGGGAPTSAELLSLCSSRRCLPSAAGGARQIRQLQQAAGSTEPASRPHPAATGLAGDTADAAEGLKSQDSRTLCTDMLMMHIADDPAEATSSRSRPPGDLQ